MFKKCNLRYILKHYLSSNTDLVFKHSDPQYSFQNKNWIDKVIRAHVLFQFVRLPIFRPTEQPVSQVVTVSSFNWWNSFTESACRKTVNFLCCFPNYSTAFNLKLFISLNCITIKILGILSRHLDMVIFSVPSCVSSD